MAEMSDLATALDKLEVTKKGEESTHDTSEKQTKEASPQASSSSPPASTEKQEEKKSESSPPASTKKQEEKKAEDSPQSNREEVTLKMSKKSSDAALEESSPPKPQQSEDSKDPSPPESKPKDSAEDDLLEFTSATEGEGEASSSAWELVPQERRIARKKGVKSDSEIDSLVKKVIKEAEQPTLAVTSKEVTSSSSTSTKDVAVTAIPEQPAEEAAAEAEATEAEALAAEKPNWEPDFSFEDAPVPPSKDVLTTKLGRKNLMTTGVTADDEDSEMADADPAAAASHPGPAQSGKGDQSLRALLKRGLCLQSHHGHLPWEPRVRQSHLHRQPTGLPQPTKCLGQHHRKAKLRAKWQASQQSSLLPKASPH